MKREAVGCTKMRLLCRYLELSQWQAVGLLESLWHLTAREAIQGNIGKLTNEEIALALDYRGSAEELVSALVKSRWLDESKTYRLIVHDWHEHADEAVKKRLVRTKRQFLSGHVETKDGQVETVSGHVTDMERLPEPEPVPEPEPGISPSMVAHAVCESCRIAGRWVVVNLEQVCKAEIASGMDPTALRDAMVAAWNDYALARPKLKYSSGAEKFFGEGLWKNKQGWPWKEGESPPPPKTKPQISAENKAALAKLREMQDAETSAVREQTRT